jgi:hypothetical protein
MDSARFSRHRARDGRDARRASGEISFSSFQGLQLLDKSQPRTGHTLTVVIIGQEETTTTERHIDGHTAVHPATASELCINGFVTCWRKITWGPGLRACKGPLIRGRHGPTTARSPAR